MRLKQLLFDPAAPCRDAGILLLRIGLGVMFIGHGYPIIPVSHPVEVGLVFVAFLFIGPGRWSLDGRLPRKNSTF